MKQTLVTEKNFVDFGGLKALIDKIGALRAEYCNHFDADEESYADLLARVDAIIAMGDDADKNVSLEGAYYKYNDAASLLQCVAKYLEDLRAELGAADVAKDATVYARLDLLEDLVQTAKTGLLDRVAHIESKAFEYVKVNSKEDISATNNIKIQFFAHDAEGGSDVKADAVPVGEINIDTTDFVVDGMVGDVKFVSVKDNGAIVIDLKDNSEHKADDADEAWQTIVKESAGRANEERFFVFTFKTTEVGTATDPFDGQATGLKNIWVSVKDLHDSYVYEGATDTAKYVDALAVTTTHTDGGATKVVYTVKLTDAAVKGLDLANGDYVREAANGARENIRGVESLHDDLKIAEADIDKLQEEVEAPETGLLDRTSVLETEMDEAEEAIAALNDFVVNHTVSVQDINDYFDFVVYSNHEKAVEARANAAGDTAKKIEAGDDNFNHWIAPNPPSLQKEYSAEVSE